jgi:hypothetical protein
MWQLGLEGSDGHVHLGRVTQTQQRELRFGMWWLGREKKVMWKNLRKFMLIH